jgi:hypothetical protein
LDCCLTNAEKCQVVGVIEDEHPLWLSLNMRTYCIK